MIRAVQVRPGERPAAIQIPDGGTFTYLINVFPDGFDGIRLAPDVIGYVGDSSLLDGSPHNGAGQALANAVYQRHAGRPYHSHVHGPMVVLGVTPTGDSTSVPERFVAQYLPQLQRTMAAGGEVR